ncbi:MAG: ATP-binding protein [bacterium]
MVVSILSWITFYHLASLPSQNNLSLKLFRIATGSVFVFFIAYYFFIIRWFLDKKKIYKIFGRIIFAYGFIFSLLAIFTNLIIEDIKVEQLIVTPVFPLWAWFAFYGYVIILTVFINILLIVDYFKSPKEKKQKIQYFLLGLLIFAILNLIFNVILQVLFKNYKFYQFGNYAAIFLLAFTAYAIVKQNLFNIKSVLTAFFVGTIAILLGVETFAFTQSIPLIILKTIVLFAFLLFGYLLIRNVKREMERRKVLEKLTKELQSQTENLQAKTQDLQSLLDIAKVSTLSLKTKEVTQEILNAIPEKLKHLEYIGGLLTMRDDKSQRLRTYAVTKTPLIQKALRILNKPFEKQSTPLNGRNSLLLKTLNDGKIYSSDKIENFITPPVPKRIAQATQRIIRMRTGVGVPITIRGKIEGVIMFAIKRKVDEIDKRDKEIMTAFANHLGLTIENSRLFEETTQKSKQLQRANKNLVELADAKSNFLSVASHQLRTPVSIVKGMLSMLVDGDVPKDKEHQFIERSFANLKRLNNIIHDLLSASAVEGVDFKLNKKMTQIDDIIKKVVEERTEKATAKNLKLIYNQPKTLIKPLNIDDNKITEVIANLIDNAIQYTPSGKIEINADVKNKNFVFKIKDTGIGIKAKDFSKLFQKISRLPNAINIRPDGTGLGLYLVQKIIKAHNGKVDVKSSGVNGEGSEFGFWLPM